ncbi:MAG: hypothetical protein OSB42_00885 [Planctomycetota bacterium]|nr:hypothetical protein [Planctomycetota bacterium]
MTSPAPIPSESPAGTRANQPPNPPTSLLLAAVGLVVVLISMPCLAQWAAVNNQEDAAKAVQVLGPLLAAAPAAHTLGTLMHSTPLLRHRFSDARLFGTGHMVEHHGYLLQRAEGGILFAWPRQSGRTGQAIYAWTSDAGLMALSKGNGRWSGLGGMPSPAVLTLPGWQRLND